MSNPSMHPDDAQRLCDYLTLAELRDVFLLVSKSSAECDSIWRGRSRKLSDGEPPHILCTDGVNPKNVEGYWPDYLVDLAETSRAGVTIDPERAPYLFGFARPTGGRYFCSVGGFRKLTLLARRYNFLNANEEFSLVVNNKRYMTYPPPSGDE